MNHYEFNLPDRSSPRLRIRAEGGVKFLSRWCGFCVGPPWCWKYWP